MNEVIGSIMLGREFFFIVVFFKAAFQVSGKTNVNEVMVKTSENINIVERHKNKYKTGRRRGKARVQVCTRLRLNSAKQGAELCLAAEHGFEP